LLSLLAVAATAAALAACSSGGSGSSGASDFPTGNVLPTAPVQDTVGAGATGDQLLAASLGDVQKAKGFRLVLTSKSKNTTTTIDMKYGQKGASGTITIDKIVVNVIRVGADTFLKSSDDFWKSQLSAQEYSTLQSKLHNHWVQNPTFSGTFAQLERFTQKDTFVNSLVDKKNPSSFLRGAEKTVSGIKVVPLTDHTSGATIYVAAVGKPYPMRANGQKGATSATATFSDWDKDFAVTAPPTSQTYVFTTG
jgi:hypothetical protein